MIKRFAPFMLQNRWFLVAFLLVFSAFLLVLPWLSGSVTLPYDAKAHFQAQAVFYAQSLARGESPFWAPYIFVGHPQIADPQSLIFSPLYALLALFNANPGFVMVDMVAYVTLFFGAIGVLLFGKDRDWHPAAVLVAACCFVFAGSAAWRMQHIGQVHSLGFFPLAFWALTRCLERASRFYGVLSGVFAALMVLGANQVSYLGLVVLFGFALIILVQKGFGKSNWKSILPFFPPLLWGALAGGLIIAVPMLMVLSFADGSNRAHFGLEDAMMGTIHPSHLLSLLIANLFGTIGAGEKFWGAPSLYWPYIVQSNIARNMADMYLGILPFFGLVISFFTPASYRRERLALLLLFWGMLAYALGRYTPVFGLAFQFLLGVDLFRRPADALFLSSALAAYLAGFGLDAILKTKINQPLVWRDKRFFALIAVIMLFFLCGAGMIQWIKPGGEAWLAWGQSLAASVSVLAVFGIGLFYAERAPLRVAGLFLAVLTLDLAFFIRPNDSTGLPPSVYESLRPESTSPTLAFLKAHIVQNDTMRDRVELVGLGFHWPNVALTHQLESTLGYNPLRIAPMSQALGAGDHVALPDQRHFSALMPGYRSPFARALGLRFIVSGVELAAIDPQLKEHPLPLRMHNHEGWIYELADPLPRVMFLQAAIPLDQDQLVKTGKWPREDIDNVVFIDPAFEEEAKRLNLDLTPKPLPLSKTGAAKLIAYHHTKVEVALDAPQGGVLVFNDAYHPWWFAQIDGQETPIWRANGAFRAVLVPPHAKKITFDFRPFLGLWLSLKKPQKKN